jgi:hypothetical protein
VLTERFQHTQPWLSQIAARVTPPILGGRISVPDGISRGFLLALGKLPLGAYLNGAQIENTG